MYRLFLLSVWKWYPLNHILRPRRVLSAPQSLAQVHLQQLPQALEPLLHLPRLYHLQEHLVGVCFGVVLLQLYIIQKNALLEAYA